MTLSVSGSMREYRPGVDVGDPHRAVGEADPFRAVIAVDGLDDLVRGRIDARDRCRAVVADPHGSNPRPTWRGSSPTSIVATTAFVAGSMRTSWPLVLAGDPDSIVVSGDALGLWRNRDSCDNLAGRRIDCERPRSTRAPSPRSNRRPLATPIAPTPTSIVSTDLRAVGIDARQTPPSQYAATHTDPPTSTMPDARRGPRGTSMAGAVAGATDSCARRSRRRRHGRSWPQPSRRLPSRPAIASSAGVVGVLAVAAAVFGGWLALGADRAQATTRHRDCGNTEHARHDVVHNADGL